MTSIFSPKYTFPFKLYLELRRFFSRQNNVFISVSEVVHRRKWHHVKESDMKLECFVLKINCKVKRKALKYAEAYWSFFFLMQSLSRKFCLIKKTLVLIFIHWFWGPFFFFLMGICAWPHKTYRFYSACWLLLPQRQDFSDENAKS